MLFYFLCAYFQIYVCLFLYSLNVDMFVHEMRFRKKVKGISIVGIGAI